MERLDAIVAGIGVLVVLTAVLGAATAPQAAGERGFRVVFATERTLQPDQETSVTGDGSAEVGVPVQVRNITRLEFHVEVSGTGPRLAADDLTITLTSPGGRAEERTASLAPGAADSASVDFAVDVASAPPERTVRAGSEEEALSAAGPGTTNGTGNWSVTVGIASQGGLGAVHAEAHQILVRTTVVAFAASVQPEVPPAR